MKLCNYCKKIYTHTKSCHVIPKAIEELRVGMNTKGGIQKYSILPESASLKQTRIDRGNFWCDKCEEHPELGGIDNLFVPKIKEMIEERLITNSLEAIHFYLNDNESNFELILKGVKSIAIRKKLFNNQEPILPDYNKITIYWSYLRNPPNAQLLNFFTRVDPAHDIVINNQFIQLVIYFGEGHALRIFLSDKYINIKSE